MIAEETHLGDVFILKPRIFGDDRGFFVETFNQKVFEAQIGREVRFVQDNLSMSVQNTLRGLHFQNPPYDQGKLVRVSRGSVLDVAVDIRNGSKTYGKSVLVVLSAQNQNQLWIPEGFAHGFVALEDNTVFEYKCTNYYAPSQEQSILWNDPDLNIMWNIDQPIVSEKDKLAQNFKNFKSPFQI